MAKYNEQLTMEDTSAEYTAFVEKFKPKKTTDDCYTPDNIYQVVLDYVANRWGVNPDNVVRPFYPCGDYERYDYPDGCVVVDNPPFSILSQIRRFYVSNGIKYFLFAPSLTCLPRDGIDCAIVADCEITYHNGANVNTAFVTNLEPDNVIESSHELYSAIKVQNDINAKQGKTELPKYCYPYSIVTAAMVQRYSKYGVPYSVSRNESKFIRAMDSQRERKKAIFGGGYLLSERATAERAAAERAAAERAAAERAAAEPTNAIVLELSDREKELQKGLG